METLRDAVIALFTIPIWLPIILFLVFISFVMKVETDPHEMKEYSALDFDEIDNDDEN